MALIATLLGLTIGFTFNWMPSPAPPATGVVFGDMEVSTMLTANKIVPATFFTNCVRTPLSVVLNSRSTVDWMMTTSAASATCSDSLNTWTMTTEQRQVWNATSSLVKSSFLSAFNTYRSYTIQRPTAAALVSGLTPSSSSPYTSVTATADPGNPDLYRISLVQQSGGGSTDGNE